jgi:hypothetical protein
LLGNIYPLTGGSLAKHNNRALAHIHLKFILRTEVLQAIQQGLQLSRGLGQQCKVIRIKQHPNQSLAQSHPHVRQPLCQPLLKSVNEQAEQQRGEWVTLSHTTGANEGVPKPPTTFDSHRRLPVHACHSPQHLAFDPVFSQALHQQLSMYQVIGFAEIHKACKQPLLRRASSLVYEVL